jgi:hypothetical protein
MVVPVGLVAGVAGNLLGGAAGGGAFEAALTAATSALGGGGNSAQLQDKMIEAGVSVMGGMMMRLAGEVLNAGMEDDGE